MRTEQPGTWDSEAGLRDGLRRLPTPETMPSAFDARVLDALRRPRPWWRTLLRSARPLLAGTACSCVVMSAALSWSLQTPSPSHPAPSARPPHATRPLDMAAVDRLLDRPGLSAASLAGLTPPHGPAAPPGASRLSPSPPRRVSLRPAPIQV